MLFVRNECFLDKVKAGMEPATSIHKGILILLHMYKRCTQTTKVKHKFNVVSMMRKIISIVKFVRKVKNIKIM